MQKQKIGQKNIEIQELRRAIDGLHDVIVGTTLANMMCPGCGYVYTKDVRNANRPYVIVVWRCPCNKLNHTKIVTAEPSIMKLRR